MISCHKRLSFLRALLVYCFFVFGLVACRPKAPADLPSLSLLLLDSSTVFNTASIAPGRPVMFIYFSPDCKQCQEETAAIVQNMDSFKDVQFYFISPMELSQVRIFDQYYKLHNYKNITVAQDHQLAFYKIFKPGSTPYQVIYDKSKKLVKDFEGGAKINKLIALIGMDKKV